MLLPRKVVREGLLHPDRDVRDAALRLFCGPCHRDPDAMPVVIQSIKAFGWEEAFSGSSSLCLAALTQTAPTVDWLIENLSNQEQLQSLIAAFAKITMISSVI